MDRVEVRCWDPGTRSWDKTAAMFAVCPVTKHRAIWIRRRWTWTTHHQYLFKSCGSWKFRQAHLLQRSLEQPTAEGKPEVVLIHVVLHWQNLGTFCPEQTHQHKLSVSEQSSGCAAYVSVTRRRYQYWRSSRGPCVWARLSQKCGYLKNVSSTSFADTSGGKMTKINSKNMQWHCCIFEKTSAFLFFKKRQQNPHKWRAYYPFLMWLRWS